MLISVSSSAYSKKMLTIRPFWSKVFFVNSQIFGMSSVFRTSFSGMSGESDFVIASPKMLINPIQMLNCLKCSDTGREIAANTVSESYFWRSVFLLMFAAISSNKSCWKTPKQAVQMKSLLIGIL